jgi:hypothetical protein
LLFAGFLCLLVILPPVSWSHYGLLLFPAILALLVEALSRRGARRAGLVAVVACVYTVLAVDMNKARDLYMPLQGMLGADTGSIVVRLLIGAPAACGGAAVRLSLPGQRRPRFGAPRFFSGGASRRAFAGERSPFGASGWSSSVRSSR